MSIEQILLTTPFAHRGLWASGRTPENSLSAFDAACRGGYGVELDVQLSADGDPIVFHDEILERMTAESGLVEERTTEELTALRLLGSSDHIPTLAETLSMIAGRTPVLIELKTPRGQEGPLEKSVAQLLADYSGRSAILSFNFDALACFSKITTDVPTGLNRAEHPFEFGPEAPDFISVSVNLASDPSVQEWRQQVGLAIAWTVKSRSQFDSLKGSDRLSGLVDNVIFEGFDP